MNQRQVAIAVGSLAGLFALACVAFAWRAGALPATTLATPDAAAAPGAALWAGACARCHAPSEFSPALGGAGQVAAATAMLDRLGDHGGLGFTEDLQVIQWLAGQAPAADEAPKATEEAAEAEDDFTL